MGVGVYLASVASPGFTSARASESWKGVHGVILESKVFKPERKGPDRSRKARISYSYVVKVEEYHGRRILFGTTTRLGRATGLGEIRS